MAPKEAKARIKIDQLLREAGWRFFDEEGQPANIQLETGVRISPAQLDALGNNFEKSKNGRLDYLLLDAKGFPYLVLEAKAAPCSIPTLPSAATTASRPTAFRCSTACRQTCS